MVAISDQFRSELIRKVVECTKTDKDLNHEMGIGNTIVFCMTQKDFNDENAKNVAWVDTVMVDCNNERMRSEYESNTDLKLIAEFKEYACSWACKELDVYLGDYRLSNYPKRSQKGSSEQIDHPDRYSGSKGDLLDAFEGYILTKDEMIGAYKFNIIKYVRRFDQKNKLEDLDKAMTYLHRLYDYYEKSVNNNDSTH